MEIDVFDAVADIGKGIALFLPIGLVFLAVGFAIWMVWKELDRAKNYAKVVYIESPDEVNVIHVKLTEVDMWKSRTGVHSLKDTKPFYIRSFFGRQAWYFVHKDVVLALDYESGKLKTKDSSDVVKKILESKVIVDLVKTSPSKSGFDYVQIGMGVAIGIALTMILSSMGILKL